MSTKVSRVYVDTDYFFLHLFEDLAGLSGIDIGFNGKPSTRIQLSLEEVNEIEKQFKDNFKKSKHQIVHKSVLVSNGTKQRHMYLCNQTVYPKSPDKLSEDWNLVTCKNCIKWNKQMNKKFNKFCKDNKELIIELGK